MTNKITLANLVNLQNETTAVNAINTNNAATTAAFNNTLSRDGTTPNQMASTLDMNSNRIINLPTPISTSEPTTLGYMNSVLAGGNINSGLISGVPVSAAMQPVVNASTIASAQSQLGIGIPTPTGAVRMWPRVDQIQNPGPWNVVDPYGNNVNTSGTTSQGLQEAIYYAINNGYPLEVIGNGSSKLAMTGIVTSGSAVVTGLNTAAITAMLKGTAPSNAFVTCNGFIPAFTTISTIDSSSQIHMTQAATASGTVTITFFTNEVAIGSSATIIIPAAEQWSFVARDVNLTCVVANAPALQFDSQLIVDFLWEGGQIVHVDTAPGPASYCILFNPINSVQDGFANIGSSRFYISNPVSASSSACQACVGFNLGVAGVAVNEFRFVEINAGTVAPNGIIVFAPSASSQFQGNIFDITEIHGNTSAGLQIGNTTTNASNLAANVWRIGQIAGGGTGSSGISTYGSYDVIDVGAMSVEGVSYTNGVTFQSSAVKNNYRIGEIVTSTLTGNAVVDAGTGNLCTFNGIRNLPKYTIATLPSSSAVQYTGQKVLVTDGNALPAFGGAMPAGGGANVFPAFWNGSAWRAG